MTSATYYYISFVHAANASSDDSLFIYIPASIAPDLSIAVIFVRASFDFISLYLFVLNFAMKLKDANYKSH